MHGIIFNELKKFVDTHVGGDAWNRILGDAGLGNRVYMPIKEYPDEEAAQIVAAASKATGTDAAALLAGFGKFLAPDLIALYRHLIDPAWKTLDLVEHTEQAIHQAVRLRNPGAHPPRLRAVRTAADEVVVYYASARRMCAVAVGIVEGLATHFGEKVQVEQPECVHRGAQECKIVVRASA